MRGPRPKIGIIAQLLEVDYELKMRRRVYPGMVSRGSMKQAEADLHIAQLEAVRETLVFCQENEADIRQFMAAKRAPAVTA